ncbi:MAG TPA: Gfo/Idh/MocA family oxidoreductase [Actinoplanes sp.]
MSIPDALPAARTADAAAAPALRWGVLGPGWIAERFVRSVQRHTRQQVIAVGSRNADRSAGFAAEFGIPGSHGSYAELVADPAVDVVYVATPHTAHLAGARLALEAGKHVLVEKPLALNAAQAGEIAQLAAGKGLFCMEALWTLFLPKFDVIRQILDSGMLGEIRTVLADHGEYFTADHRILRLDLAGGPLLDLGTYPVSFANWVLPEATDVRAVGQPHPAGVNGQAAAVLSDPNGNQAVLHTTLFSNTPTTATVAGTRGTLTLPGPFYQPGDIVVTSAAGDRLTYTEPQTAHDALYFEAAEVARCIAAGKLESPVRPVADSIRTLTVMDEIRRQVGAAFPDET